MQEQKQEQTTCRIGCVIMASGASVRFGAENKLLADCGGHPLFTCVTDTIAAVLWQIMHPAGGLRLSRLQEQTVPLSCVLFPVVVCADDTVASLARDAGFEVLKSPHPAQSDTVRDGLQWLLTRHDQLDGCMFVAGDQPLMKADTIIRLLNAFASSPCVPCRVTSGAHAGNPVIFPPSFFPGLLALTGDRGGSILLKGVNVNTVSAADGAELWDVDTPDMLLKVVSYMGQ